MLKLIQLYSEISSASSLAFSFFVLEPPLPLSHDYLLCPRFQPVCLSSTSQSHFLPVIFCLESIAHQRCQSAVADKKCAPCTSAATLSRLLVNSVGMATSEKCLHPGNSYCGLKLYSIFLNPSFSTEYIGSMSLARQYVTESVNSCHFIPCHWYFFPFSNASLMVTSLLDVFELELDFSLDVRLWHTRASSAYFVG